MTIDLNNVLAGAEGYRNVDFGKFNDTVKDTPLVKYAEICEILSKWGDSIFQKGFVADYQFSSMGSNFQAKIKKEDELDRRLSTAAMNLHRITYQTLAKNQAPTDEDLGKIQKVFQDFANSIDGASNEQTRTEFVQLSLHPRLLVQCSEIFVKYVADQVGTSDTFKFNVDNTLYNHREMHNDDSGIVDSMRLWSEMSFKPEFATKKGISELEYGVKAPYCSYYKLSQQDSLNHAATFLASLAIKANKSGEEVEDSGVKALQEMFSDMLAHFEDLHSAHILYAPIADAKKTFDEAKEALTTHTAESANRNIELTEALQKAVFEHQEAAAAQKGSLEEVLAEVVKAREENVTGAKQKLDDTAKSDQQQSTELTEAAAKAQVKFDEASNLAYRRSPVKEELASELSDEMYQMFSNLSQNVPLAVICMQEYLKFADTAASREIAMPSRGWFSWS
jgi:hypothetical protein